MADENKIFLKYFKNLKGKGWLLLLALLGVALLLFGGALPFTAGTSDADESERTEAYRLQLEEELTALCGKVEGAGRLSLVVTLEGGERAVYAADTKSDGSRDYVTSSGNGLLLYREKPAVCGVAVVCEGGDNPLVQQRLTALLSAALGIGESRIYICAGG